MLKLEDVRQMRFDKKFATQSPGSYNGFSAGVPKLAPPRELLAIFRGCAGV